MWPPPSFPRTKIVALKHVLLFLNVAGLFSLPPKCDRRGINFLYAVIFAGYFIAVMFCLIVVTIFTTVDFFLRINDVDVIADRGVILTGLILALVKRKSLVGNRSRVENLLVGVQRRHILKNNETSARHVKVFTFVWGFITISFLLPLHFRRPGAFELPTANATFLGIESDNVLYGIIYAWNVIALSFVVINIFGVDLFIVGMYVEAACRLETLGKTLEDVCSNDFFIDNECPAEISHPFFDRLAFRKKIREVVIEHCDVIKSIKELNHIFYWTLVFQSIFAAGVIAGCSFYGFISILHSNFANFAKSLMYVSGITCETWFYCKSGDRVKRASMNLTEALWKSKWYTLPTKERLSVMLIMQASNNRLKMSAGQIFRTDLESMGMVLSSAFSYFTVLRNIYKLQIGK